MFNYIHGFRMQLFFLISGFFTAMLWRKQGLRNLLKHRAKRILVPLIIATPITWILVIAIVGMYGDFPFAQAEAKFKESMNNPLALLAMGMWARPPPPPSDLMARFTSGQLTTSSMPSRQTPKA